MSMIVITRPRAAIEPETHHIRRVSASTATGQNGIIMIATMANGEPGRTVSTRKTAIRQSVTEGDEEDGRGWKPHQRESHRIAKLKPSACHARESHICRRSLKQELRSAATVAIQHIDDETTVMAPLRWRYHRLHRLRTFDMAAESTDRGTHGVTDLRHAQPWEA